MGVIILAMRYLIVTVLPRQTDQFLAALAEERRACERWHDANLAAHRETLAVLRQGQADLTEALRSTRHAVANLDRSVSALIIAAGWTGHLRRKGPGTADAPPEDGPK